MEKEAKKMKDSQAGFGMFINGEEIALLTCNGKMRIKTVDALWQVLNEDPSVALTMIRDTMVVIATIASAHEGVKRLVADVTEDIYKNADKIEK